MANRKLQAEIDRTMKRVSEGLETFDLIWDKVYSASNASLKEKYEADLKKEIKKLQRYREQIKGWITSNDIKEKGTLMDGRKAIEAKMEQFKKCEKETKTKAYSKEGLGMQVKDDPKTRAKNKVGEWVGKTLASLRTQIDGMEAQLEAFGVHPAGAPNSPAISTKRGRKQKQSHIHVDAEEVATLTHRLAAHKKHIDTLERILRAVENDVVQPTDLEDIKDGIEFYVESNDDVDFVEDDELYVSLEGLGVIEEEDPPLVKSPLSSSISSDKPPSVPREEKDARSNSAKRPEKEAVPAIPDESDSTSGKTDFPHRRGSNAPASPAPSTPVEDSPQFGRHGKGGAAVVVATPPVVPHPPPNGSFTRQFQQQSMEESRGVPSPAVGQPQLVPQRRNSPILSNGPHPPLLTIPPQQQVQHGAGPRGPSSVVGSIPMGSHLPPPHSSSATAGPSAQASAALYAQVVRSSAQQAQAQVQQPAQGPTPAQAPQAKQQPARQTASASPPSVAAASTTAAKPGQRSQAGILPSLSLGASALEASAVADAAAEAAASDDSGPPAMSDTAMERLIANLSVGFSAGGDEIVEDAGARDDLLESSMLSLPSVVDATRLSVPRVGSEGVQGGETAGDKDTEVHQHLDRSRPASVFDSPALFEKFADDLLFFIFFFQPGTYQQYLAAHELKSRSWRFHTKYLTWFQRSDEPRYTTDAFEEGTYTFFDYEGGWYKRKKAEFIFEYSMMEDLL